MNPVDLILAKRDGQTLDAEAIDGLVAAYTRGDVPDYQMSAFLMAGYFAGFDEAETLALTRSMLDSGARVDLAGVPGVKVDKHSTGGVGDKISLVLAPVVAACGVPVPMISGRGLGHSGGTLDKLEAIPGFRTDLDLETFRAQVGRLGVAMIGQTAEIAPADRKLYALRDVTGTVEFVPYITASILSKKLAEGIDALVLDVKCGRGAFMRTEPEARRLADTLVEVGEAFGRRTVAWMTRMDAPLGRAVGNWPEVREAIACLRGDDVPDVTELTCTLAGTMLVLGGRANDQADGEAQAREALASGAAFERFCALVGAQGGDVSVVEAPERRAEAEPRAEVRAPDDAGGRVAAIDGLAIGRAAMALGAGRRRKEDPVDPVAGIVLNKRVGDPVRPGDLLATLHARALADPAPHVDAVRAAFALADDATTEPPLLLGCRTADGWGDGFGG